MIVRAEMRMADEIDAGQERGEIAKPGRPVKGSESEPLSIESVLGEENKGRLAQWRAVRDAGEAVVEQAIESALAEGRAPTKADIKRAVDGKPSAGSDLKTEGK